MRGPALMDRTGRDLHCKGRPAPAPIRWNVAGTGLGGKAERRRRCQDSGVQATSDDDAEGSPQRASHAESHPEAERERDPERGAGRDPSHLPDVDALLVEGRERPSERVPLSRERILAAALRSIDEDGLAALTMRRLGARLGVEAMALYRYVPGREALLDGVVDALVEELDQDAEVLRSAEHGWQDFLQRMAHGVRRVAIAHPKAFPLVASTPPEAPWLRPPLRSIRWVETFLSGLLQEGFSDEQAVAAYRAFTSFLLGNLLLEVSQRGAAVGPLDLVEEEEPVGGLDEAPNVRRLARRLGEDGALQEFEESLESLIDRISTQVLGGSRA